MRVKIHTMKSPFLLLLICTFLLVRSSVGFPVKTDHDDVPLDAKSVFTFKVKCEYRHDVFCKKVEDASIRAAEMIATQITFFEQIHVVLSVYSFQEKQFPGEAAAAAESMDTILARPSIHHEWARYPSALLKQLKKNRDWVPPEHDIFVHVNADIPFYFEPDATDSHDSPTRQSLDFKTVIAHELLHGLGIATKWTWLFYQPSDAQSQATNPPVEETDDGIYLSAFDYFLVNGVTGERLADYQDQLNDMIRENGILNFIAQSNDMHSEAGQVRHRIFQILTADDQLAFETDIASKKDDPDWNVASMTEGMLKEMSNVYLHSPYRFNAATSISHVHRRYMYTSDFIMMPGQMDYSYDTDASRTRKLIGPRTLLMLTHLGYSTEFRMARQSIELKHAMSLARDRLDSFRDELKVSVVEEEVGENVGDLVTFGKPTEFMTVNTWNALSEEDKAKVQVLYMTEDAIRSVDGQLPNVRHLYVQIDADGTHDVKSQAIRMRALFNEIKTISPVLEHLDIINREDRNMLYMASMVEDLRIEIFLDVDNDKRYGVSASEYQRFIFNAADRSKNNDEARLLNMLRNGEYPGSKNEAGEPWIEVAVKRGYFELASALIERGVDIVDKHGWSLLYGAVLYERSDAVEFMLENGANLNRVEQNGETSLHCAVKRKRADYVAMLLVDGVNVNAQNEDGQTALHLAASDGCMDIVGLLIQSECDLAPLDIQGDTPLHLAVQFGHLNVVQHLIDMGADMNVQNADGFTPLHYAVYFEHPEMAKLLYEARADIYVVNHDRMTAMDLAIESGDKRMLNVFL